MIAGLVEVWVVAVEILAFGCLVEVFGYMEGASVVGMKDEAAAAVVVEFEVVAAAEAVAAVVVVVPEAAAAVAVEG
jgi:hypothetical protein